MVEVGVDLRFHVFESFIEKDGDGCQCKADHGDPDDCDFDAEEGGGGLLSVGDVAGSAKDPAGECGRRGRPSRLRDKKAAPMAVRKPGARMPVFHSP